MHFAVGLHKTYVSVTDKFERKYSYQLTNSTLQDILAEQVSVQRKPAKSTKMTFATTAIGKSEFFHDNKKLEQGHGWGICRYEELVIFFCASAMWRPKILAINDVMECIDYTEIHNTRTFLGRKIVWPSHGLNKLLLHLTRNFYLALIVLSEILLPRCMTKSRLIRCNW